ncbi:glycine zipper 2TM domain-containing protein [Chiayiivirga flava]|uniref:Uncharacterized protein YcfJ n=1 Tax=Chiayiivirga flava TaxID=659595 RepID=A0A7W8FY15_9GAMM|nr:uncharacterized protein YcfJ [Chiayiivirga flava]
MNRYAMIGAGAVLVAGAAAAAYTTARGDYAEVVRAEPIVQPQMVHAQVLSAEPVRGVSSVPREVCSDRVVQERLPERDGNVGGTVAGAVIGGLLGNQVGGGDGRKLATVAGAVAGGYAGREVDRRHVGGRVVNRAQRDCQTINEAKEGIVGYKVDYRTDDGERGQTQVDSEPGDTIALGERDTVVGYDVTYRYNGVERSVRMAEEPGDRLPVVDGAVVVATDRVVQDAPQRR